MNLFIEIFNKFIVKSIVSFIKKFFREQKRLELENKVKEELENVKVKKGEIKELNDDFDAEYAKYLDSKRDE